MNKKKKPLLLVILDGWGLSKKTNGNAIALANTPNLYTLFKESSHTRLNASGKYVGLPIGQAGNSEAGHMNISAGMVVEQDTIVIESGDI